jgi:hypothetical protein
MRAARGRRPRTLSDHVGTSGRRAEGGDL